MPVPTDLYRQIRVWPRQLLLETPGVNTSVPQLRGVWGAALHDAAPDAYARVFAPPDAAGPPLYVLRPSPPDARTAPAVHWVLLGDAAGFDAALARAWEVAAARGLGPERIPFRVRQRVPLGPDGEPAEADGPWALDQAVWPLPGNPATTPSRLVFPAPIRILRDKRLVERPTCADIAVAAARRVEALLPDSARADWRKWRERYLDLARRTVAEPWVGDRLDLRRWSARQRAEIELEGVVGSIDLPAGPGEWWPLLAAALWLHVGKGTALGLGELRVEPLHPSRRWSVSDSATA